MIIEGYQKDKSKNKLPHAHQAVTNLKTQESNKHAWKLEVGGIFHLHKGNLHAF